MTLDVVTTDVNRVLLPKDFFVTNYNNSSSLRVNSKSPFTLDYAIWPFVGLLSLIATVWFLVYILTVFSRHHSSKADHRNFASLYVTQDSTMAGGYEVSNAASSVDV